MKEKYFEIELVNYDENNIPFAVDTVYCRASEQMSRDEAEEFCRDDLGMSFEGVFSVNEISREDAEDLANGESNILSFAPSMKSVPAENVNKAYAWKIPITYSMCGFVEVNADTLEEAMDIARDRDGTIPLPKNADYVDGSWELSETNVDFVRMCYNDNREDSV